MEVFFWRELFDPLKKLVSFGGPVVGVLLSDQKVMGSNPSRSKKVFF